MANRLGNRGLMLGGMAEKHIGERNKFIESEIALWIEAVLDDCIPPKPFDELLRDGVLLCRVMNTLKEGSVPKTKKPFTKENQLENINLFLNAAKAYGVAEDQLFAPADLQEMTGIPKVINTILQVGRKAYDNGWEGPALGPKPTAEKRNWTEAQLRASDALVPPQYGTNKFASQKGIKFGKQRDIINHVEYKEFTKNTPPPKEEE